MLYVAGALTCAALLAITSAAAQSNEPLAPLPQLQTDPRKVELGYPLFRDPRLSRDNSVACVSCHDFARGGADPRAFSIGVGGAVTAVNSPSIFNVAFNFRQMWNGGLRTLEDQIDRAIVNPADFGSTWEEVLGKLNGDQALQRDFRSVYSDGLNRENIKNAIATYERSLITPSRFDRYLNGERDALSANERSGYALFKQYGCAACHQGVNIGGNMFQKLGVMKDYFGVRGPVSPASLGRYNITKREQDRYVFKVPSLRNVALTAPYFHDASAQTLDEAVDVMLEYQVGRTAPQADKRLIIEFLHTLTGQLSP